MRLARLASALVALCACGPAALTPSDQVEQASHRVASVEVPVGPVAVPELPAADSALAAGQILCDSFQDSNQDHGSGTAAADTSELAARCAEAANSVYRELQVQLVSLTQPGTVERGLASVDEDTTFLFPDGSYTQGASAFKASRASLFGTSPVTAIQNKFIYKPISPDTVLVIGDPSYTLGSGATVESVQYHVYSRRHKGEGSCRSLADRSGKVCWGEVAGQWVYRRPFTGTSQPHPISSARSQIPESASYPLTLEPQRIVCDGSFQRLRGSGLTCEEVVREFYKEIEYQVLALTDPNTTSSGLAALNQATTFVYPTGLVTEGLTALLGNLGNLFGENYVPVGIQNKFLYKGIDSDTVLFIGDPMFTMRNLATGGTKQVESVQVSVYRRNGTPLGNCRSATNPTGDVCWNELAEQWVYGQPLLGN
ncbi:MAG: hypothetical protein U1A78_20595 [Polyangia bacterium]